ncbi:MAG: BatA and WFA domain-containing protein [Rubripirellula sp.]
MSLASPERLMWLWIAIPIIGFYILKTRLRRRQVATLLFWDQVFEEKRQRSLWQNLRHWLSLLLQLIFVGLVAFALADPLWRSQTDSGQELILVVDNSASMQAIDPETGMSRLQSALSEAADVAKGLRQGDQIALITAGSSVKVVVGMSDFGPTIEEALETITATDGPTRVDEAIEAARRLANDSERRRVIVFSDTCLPDREQISIDQDLRWVQVGVSQDNVAITTFQVRRSTVDPIGYAVLIEVCNLSDNPVETRLRLELADALVDVIPITLEANGKWRKTIDGTSREGGLLAASFKSDDGLAVDNMARAIVPARPLIPVTLVSDAEDESFYLRTVLDAIPLVRLSIADADWNIEQADAANQLTVFNRVTPERMPKGPTLVVGASGDGPANENNTPGWKIGEEIESPLIAKQDPETPLLRHVQLQNVLLDGGRDIEVDGAIGEPTTLLETAEGSRVLVAVERPSGRLLILSADLDTSDLPLRIAFPVMMTNAMNWFFRQTGDIHPALSTGIPTAVPWDLAGDESGEAMLVSPRGDRRLVTVSDSEAAIGPLERVGVFGLFDGESLAAVNESSEVTSPLELGQLSGTQGNLLAVNLCDASESDLRLPELSEQQHGTPPRSGAPAWFYLALLAIGLVVGEWVLFNRRVVA